MKAKLIIDGREIEMELTEEQTEQIRKETKWPQVGDKYFHICSYGDVIETIYRKSSFDSGIQEIGNFFEQKEEAESAVRALKLIESVRQDRLVYNGDWQPSNSACYWFIHPDEKRGLVPIGTTTMRGDMALGFYKEREGAEKILSEYRSELEWYFNTFLKQRG